MNSKHFVSSQRHSLTSATRPERFQHLMMNVHDTVEPFLIDACWGCSFFLWPHGGTGEWSPKEESWTVVLGFFLSLIAQQQMYVTYKNEDGKASESKNSISKRNIKPTGVRTMKRKREILKPEEWEENVRTNINWACVAYPLSGSALDGQGRGGRSHVGQRGTRAAHGYVVLVAIEVFFPEKRNGEKFGVCLNIYMQGYNWW